MNTSKLIDFGHPTRSRFEKDILTQCPQCDGVVLIDNWPPNMWWGSIGGGTTRFEGDTKYVCEHCRIAFSVHTLKINNVETKTFSETYPLIERDGKLLTRHDVLRYEYFDKHGKFPLEAYA